MEHETWKPIAGYEGLYDISDQGRVRSYKNNKWGLLTHPKILGYRMGRHYKTVMLCKGADKRTHYIHRLVADAFLDRQKGQGCVNHINGNKHDNRAENLEWCTHYDNMRHADKAGLATFSRKTVVCIDTGTEYPSITEAARQNGINRKAISNCLNGMSNTAGKKHWRYAQ